MISPEIDTSEQSQASSNQIYLDLEQKRLRLLLKRRLVWLRRCWTGDLLQEYQELVVSEAKANELLDGEDRQEEERFYAENSETVQLGKEISQLEGIIDVQKKALLESGNPPMLDAISYLFNLNDFERDVLLLCLAPQIDPSFERLYAYVQDDVNLRYATPHLALTLFGGTGENLLECRRSLSPDAVLRDLRLITLDPGPIAATSQTLRPMHLDSRMADYLIGIARPEERIAALIERVPSAPLSDSQLSLVDHIAPLIATELGRSRWLSINLIGQRGIGKRAIAREICDRLGFELLSLDLSRLPDTGPERQEAVSLLEREGVLSQMAIYLDLPERGPGEKESLARADDLIEHLRTFLIVGSRGRIRSQRSMMPVEVAKPDAKDAITIWNRALNGENASQDLDIGSILQHFDFGPYDIAMAAAAAKSRAKLQSRELNWEDLWQACREQSSWQMEDLAQHIISNSDWSDIVLPEESLCQLREIASQVANRTKVYDEWGFARGLCRGKGISALFSGPSGTGKTMAAEILSNHLHLDLYRIDLSGVVNKYIGETEKNLKKVFDKAEKSGAILFFDEADALFGKRTEIKDSHDRYANIEINYLLQRMEDYGGLVILATNRKASLDQAFLRRIRFFVDMPFPDADRRRRIWQKAFPPQALIDDLDYNLLSRLEASGGHIRNISLNAAFMAADQSLPIGMTHIMQAARREYAKMDKLTTEAEFGRYYRLVGS